MKIEAVLALADVKDKQNDIFTDKCLKNCVKDNVSIPVLMNFNFNIIIGNLKKTKYKDGKLIGEMVLIDGTDIDDKFFRVGGYCENAKTDSDKKATIFENIEITSIGMIDKSKDVYITENSGE